MPCFMYIKKKLLASLYLTRSYTIHVVLEAGTQPNNHKKIKEYKKII